MTDIPLQQGPVTAGDLLLQLNQLRLQINALVAQGGGGGGGITGTLTSGLIPVASGATSVADGSLSDDGANTIGGQNGVDLTIGAGTVTTVGTVGYSYGPNLYLTGGHNVGGAYGTGGNVHIRPGSSTGASYNNDGGVYVDGNLRINPSPTNVVISSGGVSMQGNGIQIIGNTQVNITAPGTVGSGIYLNSSNVYLSQAPATAGPSGTLYVDAVTHVVKRAP